MTIVEGLLLGGLVLVGLLCVTILLRTGQGVSSELRAQIDALGAKQAELQTALGVGLAEIRDGAATQARANREELNARLDALAATLTASVGQIGVAQGERLEAVVKSVSNARIETQNEAKALRTELLTSFGTLTGSVAERMGEQARAQTERLDGFARTLVEHRTAAGSDAGRLREEVAGTLTKLGQRLDEALVAAATRQGEALAAVTTAVTSMGEANERRQEALATGLTVSVKTMGEETGRRQEALAAGLTATVKDMAEANERRSEGLRQSVEGRLDAIRTENGAKLEEMRVTVDEKLQGTLNERLGASFSMVNENLERVHKSVGEMQQIATGVGDLKRVLTNVKSRGTWGETSLGMLLEQVMTPEQYVPNVEVKPGSGCRVEYAIRLPGQGEGDAPIWVPIDAKLPTEDYERLVEASERADAAAAEDAARALERRIRACAKDISDKYIHPPHSTDFGIMFLPTEGLFAEVVRRPGLVDALNRECRVVVAGPTTLMALLSSLRMGFRTLAIQKRSSEVWQVLGAVKNEFGKFGGVLDKVGKKLGEAQKVVEDAGVRRRAVDRRLRSVEALPDAASATVLALVADDGDAGEDGPELEAAE